MLGVIFFAILFRAAGGGFNGHLDLPRWMVCLFAFSYILAAKYGDWWQVIAWCCLFVTYRLLETKPLLDLMQDATDIKALGNSFFRFLASLPLLLFVNPSAWYLVSQPNVYQICGIFRKKDAMLPEVICGILFGWAMI